MNSFLPYLIFSSMLCKNVGTQVLVSADKSSPADGEKVTLTCNITSFTLPSSWINDTSSDILSICRRTGTCTVSTSGGYSYSATNSTIVAQISAFDSSSDNFGWKCQHDNYTHIFRFTTTTSFPSSTSTTTTETVTSASSPPTSMSSTKAITNSTSVNPAVRGLTANATFSTSTPTGSTPNATFSTSTPTGSTASATFSTSTPTGSTANATFSTSTPTNYTTTGSTSTSPTKSNSSQGDDTTVIVLAVVVPIGGLLLIGVIIFVLCIRHHRPGKNDHEIPDGKASQSRSNNVDGFKQDRTAKQLNAIQTTFDQYQTPYTGTCGYQTAYVSSNYMSDRSSTHKDRKHHNVGHPYSRPYTGTYGYQNAYDPSTYMSARTYPSKNKNYDYESPYRIADSRSAYDQAPYYPHTGYYGKTSQDVYYRGGGHDSYGQRSRPYLDHSGRKQQREYYNQYEMADYGGSRTRYGQTEQYGQNTAFYY